MIRTHDKQPETDPFQCTCGPCKSFWRSSLSNDHNLVTDPPLKRAIRTSILYQSNEATPKHPGTIRVGDRVLVNGTHTGKVKFVGVLDENRISPEVHVGVQLDDNIGTKHNGIMAGVRYFHCPRGQGAIVKYTQVVKLNPPEKRPPLEGNYMYEGYEGVKAGRKARAKKDPFFYLGSAYSSPEPPKPGARPLPKINVFDKKDIAYKDAIEKEKQRRQREVAALQSRLFAQQRAQEAALAHWKGEFGSGERGETMAKTLLKLQKARKLGAREGEINVRVEFEDDGGEGHQDRVEKTSVRASRH